LKSLWEIKRNFRPISHKKSHTNTAILINDISQTIKADKLSLGDMEVGGKIGEKQNLGPVKK
jgi:hypothetical protein